MDKCKEREETLSPRSMASGRAAERETIGLGTVRQRKDSCVVSQKLTPICDADLFTHALVGEQRQELAAGRTDTEWLWPCVNFLTQSC